jgi:hypothetical protein
VVASLKQRLNLSGFPTALQNQSLEVVTAYSDSLGKNVKLEREILLNFLKGREIKRYSISASDLIVIVPYDLHGDTGIVVSEENLLQKFPRAYEYLRENKKVLEEREHGRIQGETQWYRYIYPKNLEIMMSPKIVVPDIANRASFALDEKGQYAFTSGYGITLSPNARENIKYILGLLNSKLLDSFLKHISTTMRGGFFRYFTQFLEQISIRRINFDDPTDKAQHDRMVSLVETMLRLKQEQAAAEAESSDRRHTIAERIERTDRAIDALVYALYGLTAAEIAVLEG